MVKPVMRWCPIWPAKKQFSDDDIWYQSRLAGESSMTALAARFGVLAGAEKTDISRAIELPATVLTGARVRIASLMKNFFWHSRKSPKKIRDWLRNI